MKKYIGTKTVSAEPMQRKHAVMHNLLRGDEAKKDPEDAGYHVVYEDGYHSWSPADVFEKAYKVADTPLDRMKIEYDELGDKVSKLNTFIQSEKFATLNEHIRAALKIQSSYMCDYLEILSQRRVGMVHPEMLNWTLTRLSFGTAVKLLKAGFSVRRSGWNGKGMYVVKQVPQEINEFVIPKMNSLPYKAKELLLRGENKCIRYRNQMLLVQPDGTADSWVPSSSDVFAEDWELVI